MANPDVLRFIQSRQSDKLPDGVYRRYRICRENDKQAVLTCDMEKPFLGGTARFILANQYNACLRREGALLALEDGDGQQLARIAQATTLGNGWRVTPGHGAEILFGDPSKFSDKIIRSVLNGWPDGYASIEDGRQTGVIERKPRDGGNGGNPGLFGKLRKMMQTHDWVLSRDAPIRDDDLPVWAAGVLAIIEITAHGDRS